MALPSALKYGLVKWHAVSAVADTTADPDALPDAVPVSGKVTFTPSVSVLLVMGDDPVTVMATAVTYNVGPDGVLRDAQGNDGVMLLATDSPGVTPANWTWSVSYNLNNGASRGSFAFRLASGDQVDLTKVSPVSSSPGVQIIQGPAGPPGSEYPMVIHGVNAGVARPAVDTPVFWFGSVAPTNMLDGDVFISIAAES